MIFANGFLSEGKTGWGGWKRLVEQRYPDATVYRLTWGAKELKSLTSLVAQPATQADGSGRQQLGSPGHEERRARCSGH